jgi:hypothetical protein
LGGDRIAVPSATTNPTMAATGKNRSLEAHRRPCIPRRHIGLIRDNPPSRGICFLWGGKGSTALKALLCSGNDALLEQRRALKAIHPITPPSKSISACLGDHSRSIRRVSAGCEAFCGPLGAYICRRWPWLGVGLGVCCEGLERDCSSAPPQSRPPPAEKMMILFFQSQPPGTLNGCPDFGHEKGIIE